MIKAIKRLIKANRIFYKLYFYLGSIFLKIWGLFIKTDKNLILFVVYGGKRYDDSPRFIYEYMINHPQYNNYKYIWAFTYPDMITNKINCKVKIDTFKYYKYALKSKYWITNSSVSRGLDFKKKETVNILFQHGMAGIKLIGNDLSSKNKSFSNAFDEKFDYIFIEGKKESTILQRAWHINKNQLILTGLPRNDELVNSSPDRIKQLKFSLNIPLNKKVILYAPTFREYNKDSKFVSFLKPPIDYILWEKMLGKEYILLLTAHYEVEKLLDLPKDNHFIINAFAYPHINDLILVSDILISDYSSIIFDYAITGKPIVAFAYDYNIYKEQRGLYPGYAEIFSHGIFEDQLDVIKYIQEMDYEEESKYTQNNIRDKYICNYGDATARAVKKIFG